MNEIDDRLKTALFRYGVIAPLVCRRLTPEEAREVRAEIFNQYWEYPGGKVRQVPQRTVRHWLQRYRKHGFDGLFDEFRSDRGSCKLIPPDVLAKAEQLRREEPARSVSMIIRLLEQSGNDTEALRERTLARQLVNRGATKELLKKGAGSYQRWEQQYANDLWQGDTAHGIWLRDPHDPNKSKKCKLIVFVDDASRVCTHAEFYADEQLPSLVDCFGKALLNYGRPCRLLFDNAFIYHSTTLATMCAELGIEISFCRPRAPQGKGKVERFIRTVQESFYKEANHAGIDSLSKLNALFHSWLAEQYHKKSHSGLEESTPLQRWEQDVKRLSLVTADELRRALMLRVRRKVHINTATVSVDGRDYQASPDLAGQELEVKWSPNYPESVELWLLGEFIEVAREFQVKSWVEPRNNRPVDQPSGLPYDSSKAYMQGLLSAGQTPTLPGLKADELLSCGEFVQLFARVLERQLVQQELDRLGDFFNRVAPVRKDAVASALTRAVFVKGPELHIRYYLEQLDQSLRRR